MHVLLQHNWAHWPPEISCLSLTLDLFFRICPSGIFSPIPYVLSSISASQVILVLQNHCQSLLDLEVVFTGLYTSPAPCRNNSISNWPPTQQPPKYTHAHFHTLLGRYTQVTFHPRATMKDPIHLHNSTQLDRYGAIVHHYNPAFSTVSGREGIQ